MKCAYHPDSDAVAVCGDCRRFICAECTALVGRKPRCNPCVDRMSPSEREEAPITKWAPIVKEAPFPKTDELCDSLRELGANVEMARCVRQGEWMGESPSVWQWGSTYKSLGVIDVLGEPIRWIHLQIEDISTPTGGTTVYHTHYGIPDPKVTPGFPKIRIEAAPKKSVPLVGKVVDIQWRGKDLGLGIIGRLNDDILLRSPLAKRGNDVKIRAYPDFGCWTITEKWAWRGVLMRSYPWAPTREQWDCYQRIAGHLLAEWSLRAP